MQLERLLTMICITGVQFFITNIFAFICFSLDNHTRHQNKRKNLQKKQMKSSIIVSKFNTDSDDHNDIYDFESSTDRNYSSGQCTDSMDSDCNKTTEVKGGKYKDTVLHTL